MFEILKALLLIWKDMAKVTDYSLQTVRGCCYSLMLFTEWLESHDSSHFLILSNYITV